ncbi:hypothetical protein [Alcaligenes faecalis]|uniref:hypothetical protein n=1 Tax=Alcaligenes faecalis TaxID=511 RepID=UPI00208E6E69|nr:hypothetical protein [Alcaligenes faecalis]USP46989.1 hypothetical protein J5J84_13245 [Alcaligenes faecalis]
MQLQTDRQPMPMAWIDRLFMRLSVMYGQQFAAQWASVNEQAMKAAWAQDLAGFSGEEIAAGVEACKSRRYVPNLPEFMMLCRPALDPVTAHAEAVLGMQDRKRGEIGEWSHPAVYWAAVKLGAHDLLTQSYSVIRARWEKELRESFAKGVWEPVPAPSLALPAPGADVTCNAEAQKKIEAIAAQSQMPRKDSKGWARKILDNQKGRSPAVLAMARAALSEAA